MSFRCGIASASNRAAEPPSEGQVVAIGGALSVNQPSAALEPSIQGQDVINDLIYSRPSSFFFCDLHLKQNKRDAESGPYPLFRVPWEEPYEASLTYWRSKTSLPQQHLGPCAVDLDLYDVVHVGGHTDLALFPVPSFDLEGI
jgi:hypothetical protein